MKENEDEKIAPEILEHFKTKNNETSHRWKINLYYDEVYDDIDFYMIRKKVGVFEYGVEHYAIIAKQKGELKVAVNLAKRMIRHEGYRANFLQILFNFSFLFLSSQNLKKIKPKTVTILIPQILLNESYQYFEDLYRLSLISNKFEIWNERIKFGTIEYKDDSLIINEINYTDNLNDIYSSQSLAIADDTRISEIGTKNISMSVLFNDIPNEMIANIVEAKLSLSENQLKEIQNQLQSVVIKYENIRLSNPALVLDNIDKNHDEINDLRKRINNVETDFAKYKGAYSLVIFILIVLNVYFAYLITN